MSLPTIFSVLSLLLGGGVFIVLIRLAFRLGEYSQQVRQIEVAIAGLNTRLDELKVSEYGQRIASLESTVKDIKQDLRDWKRELSR